MMSRPASSQLLAAVRSELAATIAPTMSDPAIVANLAMIDSILASVAVRCDHEIGWMREEIAGIEALASELVASKVAGSERVAAALENLHMQKRGSDHTAHVQAEYSAAGEVLSVSIEVALPFGGEVAARLERLLDQRLEHVTTIRGDFSLAGRE